MALHNLACRICGTAFQAKRNDAKYCSDACKTQAHLIRKGNRAASLGSNAKTTYAEPRRIRYETTENKPNPAYFEIEKELNQVKRDITALETKRDKIQRQIARIWSNSESINAGLAAAGLGGVVELLRDKKKRSFLNAVGRAAGAGISAYMLHHYVFENLDATQQRKINKAQSLQIELENNTGEIDFHGLHKAVLEEELRKTPKFVREIVQKEFVDEPYKANPEPETQKSWQNTKKQKEPLKTPEKLQELALAGNGGVMKAPKYESAGEVLQKTSRNYPFEGKWADIVGQPEHGFHLMLWGSPGLGKSTAALEFAKYLADRFTPGNSAVLYISSEESNEKHGASGTLRDKMERVGITQETRLQIGGFAGFDELAACAKNHPFVFLDSVTDMALSVEQLKALKQNSSLVTVHQSTKDKVPKFKGDNRFLHEADTEIVLTGLQQAEVRKNRFKGNTGQQYAL